jgi:hypothetical protein
MRPPCLAAALLALSSAPMLRAAPHHPSQDVVLIHPTTPARLHQQVTLGYVESARARGLSMNVSVSLRSPDETVQPLFSTAGGPCANGNGDLASYRANALVNTTGTCV